MARYRVAGKGEREVNVGQLQSCYVLLCLPQVYPPVRWRPLAALIPGLVGGNRETTD
jgi:hypothetical protein